MSKEYAKRFYGSHKWQKTRTAFLSGKNYICERCGGVAEMVHHKQRITELNINNPNITLNWDNLESLCYECHSNEHISSRVRRQCPMNGIAFDSDGNVIEQPNVFLVCGSPGSGKTTYVNSHKTSKDLVVDLDYICSSLMGETNNSKLNHNAVLSVALEVKTLLYKIISLRRGNWEKAFVITTVANKTELNTIANELNAQLIMIDTPLQECIDRIKKDEERASNTKLFEELAIKWHENYNKSLLSPL